MTDRETLLRYRMKQAEETLADAQAMAKSTLSPRGSLCNERKKVKLGEVRD
jgi:hypothetical protein